MAGFAGLWWVYLVAMFGFFGLAIFLQMRNMKQTDEQTTSVIADVFNEQGTMYDAIEKGGRRVSAHISRAIPSVICAALGFFSFLLFCVAALYTIFH